MIPLLWLALGLFFLALFTYLAPRFWAKRDAADFAKDPANDTFHDKFHRQRLTWRIGTTAGVALVLALPWGFFLNWKCYPLAVLAYGISSGGYFAYCFNHLLSKARNLPYVGENYVSPDPDAANPDAWIWRKVTTLLGQPMIASQQDGTTVHQLVAGLVLELLSLAVLIYSQTIAFFFLLMALMVGLR